MRREQISIIVLLLVVLSGCNAVRLERANVAHDLMQYPKSERLYGKVLDRIEDRTARARLADAHQKRNDLPAAKAHYATLDSVLPLTGDTALAYGEVLMGLGERQEAANYFLRVVKETPENGRALALFESAEANDEFYKDSSLFLVSRLTLPGISTAFGSVPYKNGILVAGERQLDERNGNPWNERSFLDLYYCESRSVVMWNEAVPLPGSVNGPYHEGPAALGPDGKTLFFTRSNYVKRKLQKDERNTSHLKLFRVTLDSTGKWGDIHEFAYNSEEWSTGHPALSLDGKTLYFASDRRGGFGGSDIWMCKDLGTGWSEPVNLGPSVNTAGNELFPTVNGEVLHFSSTGHRNMGGLDIFETHLDEGEWTPARNLNAPINTPKDDLFFVLDSTNKAGYLSSDRDGLDQVYTFTMVEPEYFLSGIVMDEQANFLANTEMILRNMDTGADISLFADEKGRYSSPLQPNTSYSLRGKSVDHLATNTEFSTKGRTRSDTIRTEVRMSTLVIGEAIAIKNIYYDYDKWDIRVEATVELDKLAKIFIDNPNMSFELGSHTDSRGAELYNLVLSDARANSAVNYLIQQGVDPDRITAKGYGETKLINKCAGKVRCTEEAHQANRRTEFRITGVQGIAIISKP